jgi:hypothetical protein
MNTYQYQERLDELCANNPSIVRAIMQEEDEPAALAATKLITRLAECETCAEQNAIAREFPKILFAYRLEGLGI